MTDLLQLSSEGIACMVAIGCFKQLNVGYKLIGLHAVIAFFIEAEAQFLRLHHLPNQWLYNWFIPIDCLLLLLASYYLNNKMNKQYLALGFLLFILVWLTNLLLRQPFAVSALIVDGMLLTIVYMLVLYQNTMSHKGPLVFMPSLWLCIGIIIFYGCSIPFFTAFSLLKLQPGNLILNVFMLLIAIRYLLTALSLLMYVYQNRKPSNLLNDVA